MADTRPLRNPHFRRLWLANIVTVVGAQLTVVAVPAQIYAQTGSSAYVGLTGVFGLVPLVVFGLWGGALADVVDRRTLLVITTIGMIATSSLFWLQAWSGGTNVWLLLSLFSVQQAFFAVNQPTRSAVLPRLLPLPVAPGGQLTEHDGDAGRRHRRSAHRGSVDPGVRLLLALPDRHDLADPHTRRGAGAAGPADRGNHREPGAQRRAGRAEVPPWPPGADDVLRRGHHRDGLRHAPGAVPRDRAPRLRWPRGRRDGVRAAVRRHPARSGARRSVLRLGLASGTARPGRHRIDPRLGCGDARFRTGRGPRRPLAPADAGRRRTHARRRVVPPTWPRPRSG